MLVDKRVPSAMVMAKSNYCIGQTRRLWICVIGEWVREHPIFLLSELLDSKTDTARNVLPRDPSMVWKQALADANLLNPWEGKIP